MVDKTHTSTPRCNECGREVSPVVCQRPECQHKYWRRVSRENRKKRGDQGDESSRRFLILSDEDGDRRTRLLILHGYTRFSKRGPKPDPKMRAIHLEAEKLHNQGKNWPQCAELLTPQIAKNAGRHYAGERLRVAVESLRKLRAKLDATSPEALRQIIRRLYGE